MKYKSTCLRIGPRADLNLPSESKSYVAIGSMHGGRMEIARDPLSARAAGDPVSMGILIPLDNPGMPNEIQK